MPQLLREKIIVQTKVFPSQDVRELRRKDDTMVESGCWQEAKKLQQQGKVLFIGFSTRVPTDVIVKTIATNRYDYRNLHWYYIFQNNWPAIEAAK